MGSLPSKPLPDELKAILCHSFLIQTTSRGRRSGLPRTFETTYVWDGDLRLYLSGYPGKRDWIANIASNPAVTIRTMEGDGHYEIPATARVLTNREERLPHIIAFVNRWVDRAGPLGCPIRLALISISAVSYARLPWWGPLFPARLLIDRMPCAEVFLSGTPVRRNDEPMRISPTLGRQ